MNENENVEVKETTETETLNNDNNNESNNNVSNQKELSFNVNDFETKINDKLLLLEQRLKEYINNVNANVKKENQEEIKVQERDYE